MLESGSERRHRARMSSCALLGSDIHVTGFGIVVDRFLGAVENMAGLSREEAVSKRVAGPQLNKISR